ncbi:MAG: PASTA domain-containing protein [Balneolaceae bacterium]|nr:MAG: PASTA domain-containing protein [Balneolaceae bacterium]
MENLKHFLTSRKLYSIITGFIVAGLAFLIIMDLIIMPYYTNYNKGVTVPDVTKLSLNEAEALLEQYGLRHEVLDRRSHSAYPANYIIDQAPAPRQIVKPNRKIYLTVNTDTTPKTVVPNVVAMSLRNAEIQLVNHGLVVGSISYESSRFRNTVLRQSVAPGDTIPRGTVVNLAISDGLGTRIISVPDVKGMRLSEGQQAILRAGLRVGEIRFQPSREHTPNTIISYTPDVEELTEGEELLLIVAERFDAREELEEGAIIDDSNNIPDNQESIDIQNDEEYEF